jgi:1-acyl-sn-glycerol-3-phosphate acyltransferase
MSLLESARGIRFVTYYFGGAPLANRRYLKEYKRGGLEAGRAVFRERSGRALRIAGAQLEVLGEENIPDGGCVLLYNEGSLVDLPLLHHVVYEHSDACVGAEIFKRIPWMTEVAHKMRAVIFERGNREAADKMLEQVTSWVADGAHLAMGGEGRLTKDGSVGHFKRGGSLVAIRARAPVVPVAMVGGPDMMPEGSLRLRPGRLTVAFGAPMSTDGLSDDDAPEFAQQVREKVVELRERFRDPPATSPSSRTNAVTAKTGTR